MTDPIHDIKNDLAVVFAYAQILSKKSGGEKEIKVIEKRIREIEKKLDSLTIHS